MNTTAETFTAERLFELLKKHGFSNCSDLTTNFETGAKDLHSDLLKELPGRELTEWKGILGDPPKDRSDVVWWSDNRGNLFLGPFGDIEGRGVFWHSSHITQQELPALPSMEDSTPRDFQPKPEGGENTKPHYTGLQDGSLTPPVKESNPLDGQKSDGGEWDEFEIGATKYQLGDWFQHRETGEWLNMPDTSPHLGKTTFQKVRRKRQPAQGGEDVLPDLDEVILEAERSQPQPSTGETEKDRFIQAIEQRDEALARVKAQGESLTAIHIAHSKDAEEYVAVARQLETALADKAQAERDTKVVREFLRVSQEEAQAAQDDATDWMEQCRRVEKERDEAVGLMLHDPSTQGLLRKEISDLTTKLKAAEEARDNLKAYKEVSDEITGQFRQTISRLEKERDEFKQAFETQRSICEGMNEESLRQRGGRLTVEQVRKDISFSSWLSDDRLREITNALNSHLAPTWTPISTPPTEKDADRNGNVEWLEKNEQVVAGAWNYEVIDEEATHWRHTDLPPIEPKVEDDGFEEWWAEYGKTTFSHIENGLNWNGQQMRNAALHSWKAALAKRGEGQRL